MIALAACHHDPEARMSAQTARVVAFLARHYARIAIVMPAATPPSAVRELADAGAELVWGAATLPVGHAHLGIWRRMAVAAALEAAPNASHVHFCDFDRLIHWAEFYPTELAATLTALPQFDLTVLGRTARAYASHPAAQRETELLINRVFALVSGHDWDVGAASRGLSRRAAQYLVDNQIDDTIGSDCSWPLALQRDGSFSLAYRACEGLEFETLDRYPELTPAAWLAAFDGDPAQWHYRTRLAEAEITSALRYRLSGA